MANIGKEIVLIVDDNPDDRVIFGNYLKDAGFDVIEASNVKEALNLTAVNDVNCILLDVNMPGISGIDMVKEMKSDPRLKFIPVIMLTGMEEEKHFLEGLDAGADDYMGKSSSVEIIIARVKANIRVKYLHDEINEKNDKLREMNRQLLNVNNEKSQALKDLDKAIMRLRDVSIRDSLTRLFNHGHFREILNVEVNRAKRYNQNLCCIMIDIDHFKTVNDTYGHLYGDNILIQLANCMQSCLRSVDLIFRYGGEEFTVLLPNADYDAAIVVAEKLLRTISEFEFSYKGIPCKVTVSIGISSLFEDGILDYEKFLCSSDTALYTAKRKGRNTFAIFKEVDTSEMIEEDLVKEMTSEVLEIAEISKTTYIESVKNLIKEYETKYQFFKEHSENVVKYSKLIAKKLKMPEYKIRVIENSAALHDLGKICVSESILMKKAWLNQEEYSVIKRHPVISVNILKGTNLLKRELTIILHHHEKYDGSGYPDGLTGESIPLGSRVVAIADSYVTMQADRPYRKKLSFYKTIDELVENAGIQFDPKIVKIFLLILKEENLIPDDIDLDEKLKDL